MQMVQDLPETISSSKTTSIRSYEIFTHWPPANTVTILPQNGHFGQFFRVSGVASSKVHKKDIDQIILKTFPNDQTTLEESI